MADAGFFRGTTTDQDNRFSDKEKKLLKTMKFEDNLGVKVDMSKVKVDVLKPWITKRVYEILKMEDDVVVEFIFNHLEEKVCFVFVKSLLNIKLHKIIATFRFLKLFFVSQGSEINAS